MYSPIGSPSDQPHVLCKSMLLYILIYCTFCDSLFCRVLEKVLYDTTFPVGDIPDTLNILEKISSARVRNYLEDNFEAVHKR